jgi:PAS domain-containing protein
MSVQARRFRYSGDRVIEIIDSSPDVNVQRAEYTRLLGYPRGFELEGRALELVECTREWFEHNGQPWVYAREVDALHTEGDAVVIDGVKFNSTRLCSTLHAAGAERAVLVAVSAGPELEEEAQARWRDGKPDEYFFLEVFGSAVVEHLVTTIGARLCAWADHDAAAVLPHYSPGYPDWTIDEQSRLLELIRRSRRDAVRVEAMDSGMLRPKKSLLAVFGVTRHVDRVRRLTELSPCENCSFAPCQYRRAPYRRSRQTGTSELPLKTIEPDSAPLTTDANYSVSLKALQRWSRERLSITPREDGRLVALFRYDGTTCTNMGRPLQFHYHVTLGPREDGYPILEQSCGPAPGDEGHMAMCRYISEREQLMTSIAIERPLHGQPLDDVIRWTRASSPAGCYCEAESRQHKWGLVLETIHYALTVGAV